MAVKIPYSTARRFFYLKELGSSSHLEILRDCVFERIKLRYGGTKPTTSSTLKRLDLTISSSAKTFRIRAVDGTNNTVSGGITIDGVNDGSVSLSQLSTLLLSDKIAFNMSISEEKRREAIDELFKRLVVSSRTEADSQEFVGLLESCARETLPVETAVAKKEVSRMAVQRNLPQGVLTKNVMSYLKGTGRRKKRISNKTRKKKYIKHGV